MPQHQQDACSEPKASHPSAAHGVNVPRPLEPGAVHVVSATSHDGLWLSHVAATCWSKVVQGATQTPQVATTDTTAVEVQWGSGPQSFTDLSDDAHSHSPAPLPQCHPAEGLQVREHLQRQRPHWCDVHHGSLHSTAQHSTAQHSRPGLDRAKRPVVDYDDIACALGIFLES